MDASDAIVDCPHCGLRVGLNRGICPACRRDATRTKDAAANLERARCRRALQRLITLGKTRKVIRRTMQQAGVSAELLEEELAGLRAHYASAIAARGPRELAIGGLLAVGGLVLFPFGPGKAWALFAFGCFRFAYGIWQLVRSRTLDLAEIPAVRND